MPVSPWKGSGDVPEDSSLSFRQVSAFLAVVEHGNLAGAAAHLHLSTSSLSRVIRDLEQTLGVALLERTPKGIRPNAAGLAFMPHAQHLARCYASMVTLSTECADHRIVVACTNVVLPQVLPRLLERRPPALEGASLELKELPSHRIREQVAGGDVDLGLMLVSERGGDPGLVPLLQAPLGLLASPAVALPSPMSTAQDLAGLPFARLADDKLVPQTLRANGAGLEAYFAAPVAVNSMSALFLAISEGQLVTIVSAIAASSPMACGLRFVPLPHLLPSLCLCSGRSPLRSHPSVHLWEAALRASVHAVDWRPEVSVLLKA